MFAHKVAKSFKMNKIKFLIIALAGLIACSCGNREIAFPDECLTFDTPSGKTLKVACVFHASLAFEYDGKVIQVDPVTQMGQMRIDYSRFGKADAIFITHDNPLIPNKWRYFWNRFIIPF